MSSENSKGPGRTKTKTGRWKWTIMGVTQTDVKPNQDKTASDSVCHQDHGILLSRAATNYSYRAFYFKRRCGGYCAVISPFPTMSSSLCASEFTSLKLLRENWQNKLFLTPFQQKEKINKSQLTSPLPDPGILNGFRASSPLERHWWFASLLKHNRTEIFHPLPKAFPPCQSSSWEHTVQAVQTKLQVWGHRVSELLGILQDWT